MSTMIVVSDEKYSHLYNLSSGDPVRDKVLAKQGNSAKFSVTDFVPASF